MKNPSNELSTISPANISIRGISRRIILGVGSAGLGQLIAAGQAILLVPLFLHAWGTGGYGHWLGLTAIISFLNLLDLGGQNYIANLMAIDYSRNDYQNFRKKLSQGVSFFIVLSFVLLTLLILFLFIIIPLAVGQQGKFLDWESNLIILMLSLNILMAIPGGVYVSVYRATGRFARGMMVGNLLRLIEFGLYAFLLIVGVSPLVYSVILAIAAIARTCFIVFDTRKHIPDCKFIKISLHNAWQGRLYLKGSLQFWLLSLSTALNQQGVLVILSIFTNPIQVAVYSTHRTAAGLIGYIGALIQAPILPEFSYLWARDEPKKLQRLAILSLKIVLLTSGLAAVFLYISLPVIYPIWTGRQLQLQPGLFGILLVQLALFAGWSTTSWSMLAANKQRLPAVWSVANAAVTIGLSLILAPGFGLIGVAVATLTGDILCGLLVFPVLSADFLKLSSWYFYVQFLLVLLVLAPLLLAAILILPGLPTWLVLTICFGMFLAWVVPGLYFSLGKPGLNTVFRSMLFRTRKFQEVDK
jgi:O-antigen/teichoic acid export membrane protein